jgi:hypothetical protein
MSLLPDRIRSRRPRRLAWIALLGILGAGSAGATAWAAFAGDTTSHGNDLRTAPDWVAPSVSSSVIQKAEGGVAGYIRQGGGYRIFASVSDSGNPASGIDSVIAGLSGSPAPLSAGAFSAAGLSYNFRGQTITAPSSLAAGTATYSVTSTDAAANTRTQTGFSVVVDNTAATATAVETQNKTAGIAGSPELGDSATLTYSETIDPNSVSSGWTGAANNAVVRIDNNVSAYSNRDVLTIYNATNSAALPLGTIDLGRNDFVTANTTFGATGTPSTLTLVGGVVTVLLGTATGAVSTSNANATTTRLPASGATDRAGNPTSTTSRTEAGTADKEF